MPGRSGMKIERSLVRDPTERRGGQEAQADAREDGEHLYLDLVAGHDALFWLGDERVSFERNQNSLIGDLSFDGRGDDLPDPERDSQDGQARSFC